MKVIKKKNFYYLAHFFRKNGKVVHREKYLGKEVPENIEEIKEAFLRLCMQEDLFIRLNKIQKSFNKEWRKYPPSIKKKFLTDLSVDFTYNSNAIEGSIITLDETEELIKARITPHKPLNDVQETIKHSRVFLKVINENDLLSLRILLRWHKELFEDTKSDIAGKIRDYVVKVGDYRAPDWQDLDTLLKEFFKWYNKNKKNIHPVELAARVHYKFEKIHPFGDGNGRVGRLIIAYILVQNKFPILVIEYKKRKSYYRALAKFENDFVMYFTRRFLSNYKMYL